MSDHQPSWMPSDETLRATAHNCTLYATCNRQDPMEDLRDVIEEAVEKAVRAHDSERFGQYLLDMRGIDGEPCRECGGVGVKAYGDTSTWRGGVGGQMITNAVCDRCWGSGDPDRPWVNLRTLKSDQEQAIRAAVEKALAEQEARHRREVLNAQVSSLVRIEALLASRRGTALQVVRDAIDALRAELAALDAGEGVKP